MLEALLRIIRGIIESMTTGIYSITNTQTSRVYVGSAMNISRRWYVHRSDLRTGTHHNSHLLRAWRKYGEQAFVFAILEIVAPADLLIREQYWIDKLSACNPRKGYNLGKKAGASMMGRKHRPESILKMSQVQKGRKISEAEYQRLATLRKGTKLSLEHRAKITAFNTGRKMPARTEEWKRFMSEKRSGKKLGAEYADKIREGLRRRHMQPDSHLAHNYIVTTPEGEEIEVYNLSAFCREHDLYAPSMRKTASGKTHQHKGWHCRYKP